MKFLEKIASRFLESTGNRLHELAFVFPTRRAKIYFLRHLQLLKPPGDTLWAPALFSIDDFIFQLSGRTVADPLDLIFELWATYDRTVRVYTKKFEDFYPWGKMILSDFDEIDQYLIDTDTLFRTLKEYKAVDDISREETSPIYNRYTAFWEDMGVLYREFNRRLKAKNRGYEGMLAREVAEHIREASQNLRWQKVIFCGLNQLTPAEQTIIRHLLENGKADIYWDMDTYFVDDPNQEAGHFFRKNRELACMQHPQWVDDCLSRPKDIHIVGVQSLVGQAKVLGVKLEALVSALTDPERVAVILPDESLLFPTLNSLPETIGKINITIGFPLQQTPVFSLFDSIMEMQAHALENEGFYHKDVQKVLHHPYIKPFAPDDVTELIDRIKAENLIYIKDPLIGTIPEALRHLFVRCRDSEALLEFFTRLMDRVREFYKENKPDLVSVDYEYMYHVYALIGRLKESLHRTGLTLTVPTFRQLFSDIVKTTRIPFTGEPLEGLQIMGMLETQTLDFDHVFVLSVNEGHLPPGKTHQSFVPFDIRCAVGLPTHNDRDAISAYHFYRLLKGSDDLTFIYVTEARGIEKSEKSRFIDQLTIEYAERNKNVRLRHEIIDFAFDTGGVKTFTVPKTPDILQKLEQKPFSASSLLNYLTCSMKFYFAYVLNLQEEEMVFESPDFRQFGTIMHETLKTLYAPFVGSEKRVSVQDLDRMTHTLDSALTAAYVNELKTTDIRTGRNRIAFEVMKKYLEHFFEKEQQRAGFHVLMLEQKLSPVSFAFDANGVHRTVQLKGTLDRLDVTDDGIHAIIDYKTGKICSLSIDAEHLIAHLTGSEAVKRKEVFQLFFYRYLLKRAAIHEGRYRLGIYSFKKLYDRLSFVRVDGQEIIEPAAVNRMEDILNVIFTEIFDEAIPFTQTRDEKNCVLCPYQGLCFKHPAANSYAVSQRGSK
ncbi:MAG: PD-(D/E)XK nuclease family protein [Candidatus Omnitrophota bacterium]